MFTVNIVTPTHKRYDKLERLINLVILQSYPNIVMHICSDGFDKRDKDLIEYYQKELDIKYYSIEHEGNVGSRPRIHILSTLKDNELCCFVDDDNVIAENYVSTLVEPFESFPETTLVICQIHHNVVGVIPTQPRIKFGEIDSLNVMTRTEVAKRHKMQWLQVGHIINHDFRFIASCAKEGKVIFIPKTLGEHRNDQ